LTTMIGWYLSYRHVILWNNTLQTNYPI